MADPEEGLATVDFDSLEATLTRASSRLKAQGDRGGVDIGFMDVIPEDGTDDDEADEEVQDEFSALMLSSIEQQMVQVQLARATSADIKKVVTVLEHGYKAQERAFWLNLVLTAVMVVLTLALVVLTWVLVEHGV